MAISQSLEARIALLPDSAQQELLVFVENLLHKYSSEDIEHKEWSMFSLESAMRDIENEESPYSEEHLMERW